MIKKPSYVLPPHALNPVRIASRRTDYGHARRPDLKCTHVYSYRLTCDEYEAMRDRAQDRCEICDRLDRETPRGELVIDHFAGGKGVWFVRGLLCDRCNSVMQRHDGTAPWGPASRPFAIKARAYHLGAFGEPTREVLTRADEVIRDRVRRLATRFAGRCIGS
ncbi:endonuclease domain-containing protein [Streptomyces sp. NPDC058231]|uniref:endonuclease domain-containing protein n=1 Tax=Streptomyces sp. NPDC058231 TaxID=3346392 RepID=UPI0036E3CB53